MTRKILIIGGGAAALSAAWGLVRSPSERDLQVTVLQPGWRLGGKGASGRNLSERARVEEHGLHMWSGCYANGFRMMQEVYALARRPSGTPLSSWFDPGSPETSAFWPQQTFTLLEEVGGERLPWDIDMPSTSGLPGDPAVLPSLAELREGLRVLVRRSVDALVAALSRLSVTVRGGVRALLARAAALSLDADAALRRAYLVLDVVWTVVKGIVRDDLWVHGVDRVDGEDFVAWLARHGASARTLEGPIVRGWYAGFFSLSHDGARRPMSAATALRTMTRFVLTYRGHFLWRMQGGMGDVVFAPLYEVLSRAGVQFRFFHRATALHADAARRLERVDVAEQVLLRSPGAYRPLVDVGGVACWPTEPDWAQIDEADAARGRDHDLEAEAGSFAPSRTHALVRGRDFDDVVLATPPEVSRRLLAPISLPPRPRAALDHAVCVPTVSLQVWTAARSSRSVIGTLGDSPLETWADLDAHAGLETERGPEGMVAFCGVGASGGDEAWARAFAERAESSIQDRGAVLDRYLRVNADPSGLYTRSPPGTAKARIRVDEVGVQGLLAAGDWLTTGLNAGCVEAAVMSGLAAARAIVGERQPIIGEDDWWLFEGVRNRP